MNAWCTPCTISAGALLNRLGTKSAAASEAVATPKLIARTRSDLAKLRTIVSRPTGTIIAPPRPCSTRQATSMCKLVASPHSKEPRLKSAMAVKNTCRVPKR